MTWISYLYRDISSNCSVQLNVATSSHLSPLSLFQPSRCLLQTQFAPFNLSSWFSPPSCWFTPSSVGMLEFYKAFFTLSLHILSLVLRLLSAAHTRMWYGDSLLFLSLHDHVIVSVSFLVKMMRVFWLYRLCIYLLTQTLQTLLLYSMTGLIINIPFSKHCDVSHLALFCLTPCFWAIQDC